METLDSRRICRIEGCKSLGRWSKKVGNKIYRGSLCDRHHRKEYHMEYQKRKFQRRFKDRGLCNKCSLCGWIGPCDIHKKEQGGQYNMKNVISICPNCHRLVHLGKIPSP